MLGKLKVSKMSLHDVEMTPGVESVMNEYGLSEKQIAILYTWDEKTSRGQTQFYQEYIEDYEELGDLTDSRNYNKTLYRGVSMSPKNIVRLLEDGFINFKSIRDSESWGIDEEVARMFLHQRMRGGHPLSPKDATGNGVLFKSKIDSKDQIIWVGNPMLIDISKKLNLGDLYYQITGEEEVLVYGKTRKLTLDENVSYIATNNDEVREAANTRWPESGYDREWYIDRGKVTKGR